MEKALLLSPSQADAAAPGKLAGYSTLIVGSEFCQNQVPSAACLNRLRQVFPGRLALATSLMMDAGLARWKELLRRTAGTVSEVIVNDWGFLAAVRAAGFTRVSAGRLMTRELVKMERGWARAFLKKNAITSAEADTPELAALASGKLGLRVSRHPGFVFRAVTTYCPFERHFRPVCGHACEGRLLKLSSRCLDFKLVLAEKAYFTPVKPARAAGGAWRDVTRFLP